MEAPSRRGFSVSSSSAQSVIGPMGPRVVPNLKPRGGHGAALVGQCGPVAAATGLRAQRGWTVAGRTRRQRPRLPVPAGGAPGSSCFMVAAANASERDRERTRAVHQRGLLSSRFRPSLVGSLATPERSDRFEHLTDPDLLLGLRAGDLDVDGDAGVPQLGRLPQPVLRCLERPACAPHDDPRPRDTVDASFISLRAATSLATKQNARWTRPSRASADNGSFRTTLRAACSTSCGRCGAGLQSRERRSGSSQRGPSTLPADSLLLSARRGVCRAAAVVQSTSQHVPRWPAACSELSRCAAAVAGFARVEPAAASDA
jgi:hypothetical protein